VKIGQVYVSVVGKQILAVRANRNYACLGSSVISEYLQTV